MSTASDRQRSVNDRIRLTAQAAGVDANRVRRSVVFQRLLVRLAPHGLVLKGGYSLEVRLPGVARATKDVDLVGRLALAADADALLDALEPMLEVTPGDGFTFRVESVRRLREVDGGQHAWRLKVEVLLDRARFETVTVDLVGQVDELVGATELLSVACPVLLPGCDDVVIEAADVYQHAAEKFHAYARIYAQDRPSSRVKDLVDLVLLVEAGLLDDNARLRGRLDRVHSVRDGSPPPAQLASPPEYWTRPFAVMAAELGLTARVLTDAHLLVRDRYAAALTQGAPT